VLLELWRLELGSSVKTVSVARIAGVERLAGGEEFTSLILLESSGDNVSAAGSMDAIASLCTDTSGCASLFNMASTKLFILVGSQS
jgi:hypothetical protein